MYVFVTEELPGKISGHYGFSDGSKLLHGALSHKNHRPTMLYLLKYLSRFFILSSIKSKK